MSNDTIQIRLSDLVRALVKNRIMIVALTLVGLAAGIILSVISYARGEITKEYAVSCSLAVTSVTEDGLFTTHNKTPNSTDIYLAENMVDSVIYVLKSDKMLNAAVNRIGLIGIAAGDISSHLQMKQYNETQIIEITLYWRSAEEGVQILDAINSVAPSILVETLKIGGVSVVNAPKANHRVGGSVNASLWICTALVGLALGLVVSLIQMILRPTLTHVRDMTSMFSLPVIGKISKNRRYFQRRQSILNEESVNEAGPIWDEFAAAAHLLLYRMGHIDHACMYVTSANSGEGKTGVAAHLAVQLSDMGKKVLLVDLDVRNPTLGTMFLRKVAYTHSLNALYRGDTDLESAITHLTGNLDLLSTILERKEIPLSDEITQMIQVLSKSYDMVIIDTPPIGMVSDSLNLNKIVKDVLFVVRFDYTDLKSIRNALERLELSGADVIGCVVNAVAPLRESKSGKNYNYSCARNNHIRQTTMNSGQDAGAEK